MGNLLGNKDIHEPDETNSMEGVVADIYQSRKLSEKEDSKVGVAADNTHQSRKLTEEDNFEEGVEVEDQHRKLTKEGPANRSFGQIWCFCEDNKFKSESLDLKEELSGLGLIKSVFQTKIPKPNQIQNNQAIYLTKVKLNSS